MAGSVTATPKERNGDADEDEQGVTSFDDVYDAYHQRILTYARYRLQNVDGAEDIAADVFGQAWERWATGESVELSWLYRVTSNKLTDHYRSTRRREEVGTALTRLAEETADAVDQLETLALEEALLGLDDRSRCAVILHHRDGLPASEIANVLGCSQTAAWAILSRARKRLRVLLGDIR